MDVAADTVVYEPFRDESSSHMPEIMALVTADLSEPYSIYVFRYFLHQWPELCYLARTENGGEIIGVTVCRCELHRGVMRGYIAMVAVSPKHRRKAIGSTLVKYSMDAIVKAKASEIVLETEVSNVSAMRLYENLGFIRHKRLHKYYLNTSDAFRFILPLC